MDSTSKSKIGLVTCISVIVSSMVGVGVYTSLGYQVGGLSSTFAILCLWVFGGVMALCGALTYGELAVRFPRSGGEYNFLSQIYHPAIGFISGWISSTVGFAGPAAAAALVFATYFNKIFDLSLSINWIATMLVVFISVINVLSFRLGSLVQSMISILNILLMCIIVVFGLSQSPTEGFNFTLTKEDVLQLNTDSFGISLVFVSFAFSGWNAITYIINDVEKPSINVPRSLIISSLIVMLLYVLLNFVFLYTTPTSIFLSDTCDGCTGFLAGSQIFGALGGKIVAGVICIGLFASINSYTLAGPRVIKTIGEDFKSIKMLAQINDNGSPVVATVIQTIITVLICWISKFQSIIVYLGLTLSMLTVLTVMGVFICRFRDNKMKKEIDALDGPNANQGYRTLGYPVVPILFILIEIFMIYKLLLLKPEETYWMFATVASGLLVYFVLEHKWKKSVNGR